MFGTIFAFQIGYNKLPVAKYNLTELC